MNIERQSEQWPHRREAMQRAAMPERRTLEELAKAGYNTDEWKEWQRGGCIEYAHALRQKFPHLNAGIISTPGDEDDWQHIFVHDDTHAYDSAGSHPLPYTGVHNDLEQHLGHNLDWYDEPDPYLVDQAHKHIERNKIGPRTASRHTARNDYNHNDWDDEDDEPEAGYVRENNPVGLRSPLYPDGHKSRPSFTEDIGDSDGRDRLVYHFSPHDRNPISDSPARPHVIAPSRQSPEGILPLEIPSGGSGWTRERDPFKLYRGLTINLNHPDLQWMRRTLYGKDREDTEDHVRTPPTRWSPHITDKDSTGDIYFGPVTRQPYLDPSMTNESMADSGHDPQAFLHPDLKHRMTHAILDHMQEQRGGMGTHWGAEDYNAHSFAGSGGYSWATPGNDRNLTLPVMITHNWMGNGEDPYRRGTEGEYPDEQEVTHLPGARVNVSAVHIKHPQHGWTQIFNADDQGDTLTRQASR